MAATQYQAAARSFFAPGVALLIMTIIFIAATPSATARSDSDEYYYSSLFRDAPSAAYEDKAPRNLDGIEKKLDNTPGSSSSTPEEKMYKELEKLIQLKYTERKNTSFKSTGGLDRIGGGHLVRTVQGNENDDQKSSTKTDKIDSDNLENLNKNHHNIKSKYLEGIFKRNFNGDEINKRKTQSNYNIMGRDNLDSIGGGNLLSRRHIDSIGGGNLLGLKDLNSIGGGNLLDRRNLDSIGGGNLLSRRHIDSIGGGNLLGLRDLDSIGGGNLLDRRNLDSIGGGNLLSRRYIDSIGGGNLLGLRDLDSIGGGNLLDRRHLDSIGGGNLLSARNLNSFDNGYTRKMFDTVGNGNLLDRRNLDSIGGGGGNLIRDLSMLRNRAAYFARQQRLNLDSLTGDTFGQNKRFDSYPSWGNYGGQKRNMDEMDRSGFSSFIKKKNFDEIDRSGFDGFVKRNFDEMDRAGFGSFVKRDLTYQQNPHLSSPSSQSSSSSGVSSSGPNPNHK